MENTGNGIAEGKGVDMQVMVGMRARQRRVAMVGRWLRFGPIMLICIYFKYLNKG